MDNQVDEVEFEKIKKRVIDEYNNSIIEMKKEKEMYARKIEYIQHQIHEIEHNKQLYCKSTGGHTWQTERESGLYGELFTYCENCKIGSC